MNIDYSLISISYIKLEIIILPTYILRLFSHNIALKQILF